MKEYKYKINGNIYKVAIGDIEDNIAHVEVNGTPYKVEMEKAPKVVVKPVARPTRYIRSRFWGRNHAVLNSCHSSL